MSAKPAVSKPVHVTHEGPDVRLDHWLAEKYSAWSRTALQKLVKKRMITVDGHPVSPNHKLRRGQKIEINWPMAKQEAPSTHFEELPFPIIFEDEHLFAVNKPAGLVVHPAHGHLDGHTLVEMVRHKVKGGLWPDDIRPGLVHRLDRDTSGVMVMAKTPQIQAKLSSQFSHRQVQKTYFALVKGAVKPKAGVIESNLARHPGARQKYAVTAKGRYAKTEFTVSERLGDHATLLEVRPLTGRTHQIRVHLASFNHPILGDHVYGVADVHSGFVKRQMLHAGKLMVRHPETQKMLTFEAPLPDDFQQALKLIRLGV